ncbi:phosphate ABC transporter permease PstA [Chitinophagaceae bacterium LB-8]|uniref:Phosphate transport system permease protein PstA n=1 Tax=Paraflavisolibacter caeni TaxID=2982496 RepID=A0A9X3B9D8_9BACT|nr:phosphate ABC transporter permease PstA [Paraflavisolibacter caeni]MCU7551106.1 phosphate ABC transporter permease PstA [Paraflavisolibacter caeni]
MNKLNPRIKYRLGMSKLFHALVIVFAFMIAIPLIAILFFVIKEGITKINWNFLTNIPKPVGEVGGGIANALLGSLIIVLVAAIIAIPIGIFAGIYLSENKNSRLSYWSRLAVDILQGVPSIVIGIVIYFWIVKPSGTFSAISGSMALAVMMLPIIIRSTEETLKLIPFTIKEAGFALGLPYHKVILKVIVPCGFSGILSGAILSVARIAGETAPLLFTAFGNPYLNANVAKPMQSLPLLIFNYATSPYEEWHNLAWGASMILLIWILLLNIITKLITQKWKVQL